MVFKAFQFKNYKPSVVLKTAILNLKKINPKINFVDLGCGDGRIVDSLIKSGLLNSINDKICGLDISPESIKIAGEALPDVNFLEGDVLNIPIEKETQDIVNASMIIEHVKDDEKMIEEVFYILKRGGYFVVSTVVKKRYGIYLYRKNGRFVLDPTHEREYSSLENFCDLFKNKFSIIKTQRRITKYSLIELLLRFLVKIKVIKLSQNLRLLYSNRVFKRLSKFLIPIPGFYEIEILCQKLQNVKKEAVTSVSDANKISKN